jgi:cytochrome P450 monooxygenase
MADFSWATSILVAVITLVLSRKLLSFISFSARSRRNGCKAPARYPHRDPTLGLDYFMTQMKERKEGNSLAGQRDRFARLGHTYEVNSWGTRTIQTMDPQNIHEVLVTSFDKFGVQEMRLSVGMPFLGPGVFSTDGRYWAISRKMIKPAFSVNPFISDFEAFDVHVDRMLKRLPRDESTIELQSLLKFMVCQPYLMK